MTKTCNKKRAALKAAFPHTIPILAGFGFLGMSFGVLMSAQGHPVWLSIVMSAVVYAGSMQFVTIELLAMAFHPVQVFLMTPGIFSTGSPCWINIGIRGKSART